MTDTHAALADERARRFDELLQERVRTLRGLNLDLTEEQLLEAAVRMAAYQLRDEDAPPTGQMPAWPRPVS